MVISSAMQKRCCINILFYILIPEYRVGRYIDVCMESVTSQGYKNWRLVLVDDSLLGKSGEICDAEVLSSYQPTGKFIG